MSGVTVNGNVIAAKVDDTSIEFDATGSISVKDGGIATAMIADSAITTAKLFDGDVTTAKIDDEAVTLAKMADLGDYKVIGNVSGASTTPAEVSILKSTDGASDSETALTTEKRSNAYSDASATTAANSAAMQAGATLPAGSMPTSYTDLDLSGTTGSSQCFVHLSVAPDATCYVRFRENGEAKAIATDGDKPLGTSACYISSGGIGYVSLITDTSGVVEWTSSAAGSGGTVVKLLCYQVLQ